MCRRDRAEPQGNPAGESFELCAWEDDLQAYTVGQELPAGVYDVNWNQGSGFLGWDTQGSVSYTHLDVYKRQPLVWSCFSLSVGCADSSPKGRARFRA